MPINPEKYSCYSQKKIHTRNLITKKNSCSSKIPPPPHNFSNGPFLIHTSIVGVSLNPIKPTIIFLTRIIQMRKWGGGHDFSNWRKEGGVIERGRGKSF